MKTYKYFSVIVILALLIVAMPVADVSGATINTGTLNWSVQYLIDQSQNSQFNGPRDNRGLALSPDGQYLYAGYNNGPEVRKIDLTVADYTYATVARTTDSRGKAIAVDDQGRVYLAEGTSIKIYDADLSILLDTISGLASVEGVAVTREGSDLALYATDRTNKTLTRWVLTESGSSIAGATQAGLGGTGEIFVTGAVNLRGVEVDPSGKIWMADHGGSKVFRVNSDGTGLESVAVTKPMDIGFDDAQAFVTQYTARTITVLKQSDMTLVTTLTPPWVDLKLDPDGQSGGGALSGIAMGTGSFFYVANEAGQTANEKSTYGRTDEQSGYIGDDFYTDLTHDDNDSILKAMVPNQPPVADPDGPYLGAVNTPIAFDGSGSFDPDGNPLSYAWTFGDGSTGTGVTPAHSYTATGIYDVCLTVNDGFVDSAEVCTYAVVYDPSGGFVTGGGWIWSQSGQTAPIYNSIPATMPGSFPSLGYQATSTDETGDHIAFAGTDRALESVTVSLTDWACENDFAFVGGTWIPNRSSTEACVTTPGSGFNHPITLNIYQVDNSGSVPAVGALIATKVETFFIPFRPSWDSAMCGDPSTDVPFGGTWYDPVLGTCVHGYAFNIDFDFSADGITLPDEVIYGIAYNTSHYGSMPLGANGPYNSLNLSLTTDAPTVGTDVEPDTAFWDTSHGPFYCDGGAGGTDTFRRDAGCWAPYTPVVQFNVQTGSAYKLDPTLEGKATFGFVSKYKKGATVPEGNTEFQFKAGDLHFQSANYEWLVVTGSNYAKFKGSGTINGQGDYKFQLWAGDGTSLNGLDTFRIKIWYEDNGTEVVVYDNGMDQEIGGGSIVVHKAK